MKQRLAGLVGAVCLGAAALVAVPGFAGVDPSLPDLVPTGLTNFLITNRFCGGTSTFEFSILTANIGGQGWTRPQRSDGSGFFRMPEIYEYTMYNWQQVGTNENGSGIFDWVEINRRRKGTICTIDSQIAFSCIAEFEGHICSSFPRQGISRGWADAYTRGLTGQYSCIMDFTGDFLMEAELDPDYTLADDGILPPESIDATHDNNLVDLYFSWDGTDFTFGSIVLYFDPDAVCPM